MLKIMNRCKQLELIQRVTHERANGALRVALSSRLALQQSQQQMEQLLAYRKEYNDKFLQQGGSGISAVQLNEYRHFLERIDQAIAAQKQVIQQNSDQWIEQRDEWQKVQSHEQAIGNVVEQRYEEERHIEQQQEQKLGDENAQIKGTKQGLN